MPAPTGAHVFKNAIVTIDAVEYANQVRVARLVPDQPVQQYKTLVPDGTATDVDTATWTFEITGLQINDAGGLSKALRDADGTQIEGTLQLKAGTGQPTATFTFTAMSPPFGGEQGSWLEMELSMPVEGTPVWGTSV